MSPEYAMEGLFSVKSDVYSFGILVLEIISGRKNNSYYLENSVNLIGHVSRSLFIYYLSMQTKILLFHFVCRFGTYGSKTKP